MPKTFKEIPRERPVTPLLDRAGTPDALRRLGEAELETLADELRLELLYSVGQTGGHFGAGLGVIELTIALHYVFDTPDDRLVWDVGLPGAWEMPRRTEEYAKGMLVPGTLFEELGWNYIGPIDGHDLPTLVATLRNMRDLKGPQFLHVVTKKGKGFAPAEVDPIGYHAITKLDPLDAPAAAPKKVSGPKYAGVFGQWICDMASQDLRLVGITPAMKEGSDLVEFAERFPQRYFDVAIAEQHAVTLAAGMACEGSKPVVAIYSTFLQRGYDQLVHDVAVQNLDVLFAIDRAGLVGEDGPTHAGSFDLSYLRCIPGMVIMTPSDENELRKMLTTGYLHEGPAAVRYPRGTGPNAPIGAGLEPIEIGKGVVRRQGKGVAILVFGVQLADALKAAEPIDATVVDMRFVKPLDEALVREIAADHELLVTVEENSVMGGAGAAVSEFLAQENILRSVLHLGLPDVYVEHAKPAQMLAECGLDAEGIAAAIARRLELMS